MKVWSGWFNVFLGVAMVAGLFGCRSTDEERQRRKQAKEKTALQCCLEVNPDGTERVKIVHILRSNPVAVSVDSKPILIERDVEEASVVDDMGGFGIKIQFNPHGARVLEMISTSYKGQKLAIFSQFDQDRWLAAPVISQNITNGVIVFTPDASREEAERIVRGLNNLAKEVKKKNKF